MTGRSRRPVGVAGALFALLVVASACTSGARVGSHGAAGPQPGRAYQREAPATEGHQHGEGQDLPFEDLKAADDWYYGQRMLPGTRIPALARISAVRQARVLEARTAPRAVAGASVSGAATLRWHELGPKPIQSTNFHYNDPFQGTPPLGWHKDGGRVTAIAVQPHSPNVVYVGNADGGVWKTSNGGTKWHPLSDRWDSLSIGAIAIPPSAPRTVYVGTGEANTSSDSYYGVGVYRSFNGGATWKKLGGHVFDRATIFRIATLAKGRTVLVASNRGLFRSTNFGNTWKRELFPGRNQDLYGNFVTDVVYLPGSTVDVLAVIGWRGGDPFNGLYLSHNGGRSFQSMGSPPGFAPQANIGRVSLGVGKTKDLIFAVVQDAVCFNAGFCPPGTLLNGVYKTTTGPDGPWAKVADSSELASDPNSAQNPAKIGPGYQPGIGAWYNQYVQVDPTNSNDIVMGLEEVYHSSDGGQSWHTIGRYWNVCISNAAPNCGLNPRRHPTTHPDQHAAAFTVVKGRPKLYVGNDGGMWSQIGPNFDNDHWRNLNTNLGTSQPYYSEASKGPNPVIYMGTQDNGNIKYTGKPTWPEVFSGDGGDVAVEPDNPNHTYEEYVYLEMSKSANGGRTWTNIAPPDHGSSATARFIAPFDLDPLNPQHIVALGRHVWLSTKGINTTNHSWKQQFDNGPNRVGTALAVWGPTIYEGWCGPCNPNFIEQDDPFRRGLATNADGTWHMVRAMGLPHRYITGITIDPSNSEHIFVTVSAFSRRWIPRAGEGHVFESHDHGAHFTDISANLPDAPANDTVLFNGRLIVGTDVGVFKKQLSGTKWSALGAGLPHVSVLDLALVPGGHRLIATTHGRGDWIISLG